MNTVKNEKYWSKFQTIILKVEFNLINTEKLFKTEKSLN